MYTVTKDNIFVLARMKLNHKLFIIANTDQKSASWFTKVFMLSLQGTHVYMVTHKHVTLQ